MQRPMLAVGDPIEDRCTKCRKNTRHIIIAMGEAGPAKLQCTICSRQRKYLSTPTAKKASTRRAIDCKDAERSEWKNLRPGMNSAEAMDYSMTAAYKVKALIKHPLFGLGLVQRIVGPQKVEILFEDGKKTMRCR